MNNKIMKIFLIILIFLSIFSILSQNVYATIDEQMKQADDFLNAGKNPTDKPLDEKNIREASEQIYNILLTIGIVIAVIVAAVLGIQFMLGGLEEQAKVKESLIPFIIGCVVIFGAFGIWRAVASVLKNI